MFAADSSKLPLFRFFDFAVVFVDFFVVAFLVATGGERDIVVGNLVLLCGMDGGLWEIVVGFCWFGGCWGLKVLLGFDWLVGDCCLLTVVCCRAGREKEGELVGEERGEEGEDFLFPFALN
mmetsp:Transcript_2538/g.3927  ORF Transcript_2538/g.3927 Transcript_2538/m.3927 type:complete len:121 (-) Transcript_2538:2-364(-)